MKKIGKYAHEVSFRKDSELGKWLINNYKKKNIIYEENNNICVRDKEYIVFENNTYSKKRLTSDKKLTKK